MYALDRLGDLRAVAFMFEGDRSQALKAVRRRVPWMADDTAAMTARSRAELDGMAAAWFGPPPEAGPRRSDIVVDGAVFRVAPDGTVLRDGRSTGLRIDAEHNCWTVVDPRDVDFRPRRHYVGMGGRPWPCSTRRD